MRRLLWVVVVVVLSLARSAVADPRTAAEANALIERGLLARADQRDAEALDLFQRALEADPSPRALVQVALAEQALARWTSAEKHLVEAMNVIGDPWVDLHRPTLQKALEVIRSNLATVEIRCEERGAQLWLNGFSVGPLPLPAQRVAAGVILVEVRAEGFNAFRDTVVVEPRQSLLLIPTLAPAARSGPQMSEAPLALQRGPHDTSSHEGPSARRAIAWTTLAMGGTLLAGALAANVVREVSIAHYNDDSQCANGALSREQKCGRSLGQADVAGVVAIAGYAAAAAAFATSSYFFVTVDRVHAQTASADRWEAAAVLRGSF